MAEQTIIELDNISFGYNDDLAVEDISISISKGDYAGIIGPNGGGKTTIVKIILDLLKPRSGTVKVFGQDVDSFHEWFRIGYLPQKATQADINFPITVAEVVGQGRIAKAGLLKRFGEADQAAIEKALRITEVAELTNRLISDLSGGERQRVYVARALASEPDILILDEPTTGIDVASQSRFYRFLRTLNSDLGITVVFVSHDVSIMTHESSRLICVNRRLVCDGPVSLVLHENKHLLENLYGENLDQMFH